MTPDGFHIAYAVLGEGDLCHVFMPEISAHVDEAQGLHPRTFGSNAGRGL